MEFDFTEAASIWLDSNSIEMPDPDHSEVEDRWIRMGISNQLRVLVVVFVEKVSAEKVRLISARKANRNEETQYLTRNDHEK